MAAKSTSERWGWVTRTLHWSIALMILGMIAAGLYAVSLDKSTPTGEMNYYTVIDVHKSFGMLIGILGAFRVLWRANEPSPDRPPTPKWEIAAAGFIQKLLYISLFLMPATGFLWATAYGEPARFFTLRVPGIIHLAGHQATFVHHVHIITAFILMGILGLHVVAALKNHFIDKNEVLRKMLGLAPRRIAAPS